MSDRLHFPDTQRNREAIAEVLGELLAPGTRVLELACGSGQHAAYFRERFPDVVWQATDLEESHCRSARGWGVEDARQLDVMEDDWGFEADLVVAINLLHISPWECGLALLRGAARHGQRLYLYGAYFIEGRPNAPSNEAFDAGLRRQDPRWGVRQLGDVVKAAAEVGLELVECRDMPANNFSLIFRRVS